MSERGQPQDQLPSRTAPPEPRAVRTLPSPPSAAPPAERRLHPVTPWRRAWAPVAALVGFVTQDPERSQRWFEGLSGGWLLALGLALVLTAAGYGFLSWWVTRFSVTETELRIRTGLLFRRVAHFRLDRVQGVEVTRSLLARVFGVAKLRLDVVGAEKKDELAFLGERDACRLRAELLARAAGIAPDAALEVGEAPAAELVRIDGRTLATSLLLLSLPWVALSGLLAVPLTLRYLTGHLWAALGLALPVVGGIGWSGLRRFLRGYDWTVSVSPDGMRLNHGLLDREHTTVPPGRVQAVRLVEPLMWRRRGWVRVEVEVAGGDGGPLLPVVPRQTAEAVLARVLPEIDLVRAATVTAAAPPRARWCAPVLWRGYGHGTTDTVFAARQGRFRRVLTVVPHAKVQSVRLTQRPWQRLFQLADIRVDHGANGTATARLRDASSARDEVFRQASRSRTGRRAAPPERWLT